MVFNPAPQAKRQIADKGPSGGPSGGNASTEVVDSPTAKQLHSDLMSFGTRSPAEVNSVATEQRRSQSPPLKFNSYVHIYEYVQRSNSV